MFAPIARQGLAETGIVLLAAAPVSAAAGAWHMAGLARAYGPICGLSHGAVLHCAACSASGLLLAAGLAALALAHWGAPVEFVRAR